MLGVTAGFPQFSGQSGKRNDTIQINELPYAIIHKLIQPVLIQM